MSEIRSVRVTNLIGNVLADFSSVDVVKTSGLELRQMVSKIIGFPAIGIKLLSASGELLHELGSLELLMSQEHSSEEQGLVTVACVLSQMQPVGRKEGTNHFVFGSKAGMILSDRLRYADKAGRPPAVIRSRNPDPSLKESIKDLITISFASGLAPLIEMGVNAAFHNAASSHSVSPEQAFLYEDTVHNAFADLSLCQVWAYSMQEGIKEYASQIHFLRDEMLNMNPILCSVIWRLLPSWQNKGPVLEILFLATSKDVREQGWALELVDELEETAMSMGCFALVVAAVPVQGMNFWTQRCGFEVVVPLKTKSDANSKAREAEESKEIVIDEVFEEPVSDLGQFLLQNMLLFTDTPLVAKILSKESQTSSQKKEEKVPSGSKESQQNDVDIAGRKKEEKVQNRTRKAEQNAIVEHEDTLPLADQSDRWCCPRRRA